jgi:hypothetical protein
MSSVSDERPTRKIVVKERENGFEVVLDNSDPETRYMPVKLSFMNRFIHRLLIGWRGPRSRARF